MFNGGLISLPFFSLVFLSSIPAVEIRGRRELVERAENGKVVKRLLEGAGRIMALNKVVNRAEINKETRFMQHGQLHF